ncbi:hypothetical protein SO802_032161 [Lithocarpus litseifolius]|uniref:Myb-like domain-containing protein n=1 Tax=Lithocarpus litseifolius TaxID=425828 RepID=A0AAW2BT30_9ROSI
MNPLSSSRLLYHPSLPSRTEWSSEEKKIFEESIKEIPLDCPHIFEIISSRLPLKSVPDLKARYGELIEGIFIPHRSGFIQVPDDRTSEIGETSGDRSVAHGIEETPKKKQEKVAPVADEKPKRKRRKSAKRLKPYVSQDIGDNLEVG